MTLQNQHETLSAHNNRMLSFIDAHDTEDCFRDWYITISYYTALHYFESILPIVVPKINRHRKLSFFKEHYYDHGERLTAMADAVFVDIHKPYSTLHKISKAAKYNEYDTTRFTKEMVKGYLTEVERACRKVKGRHL